MSREIIQELLSKYQLGLATPEEVRQIEEWIEAGVIHLENLEDLQTLEHRLEKLALPVPSEKLDAKFYDMLKEEKNPLRPLHLFTTLFTGPDRITRLSFAAVILFFGVAIGYFFASSWQKDTQVDQLAGQLADLKELMVLSMLEKEEATERLKAVSLTNEMDEASARITHALLQTLNNDENINVRLAALEALKPYTSDSRIREELVRSIKQQHSPLVQVALAELMAALQEKSSVKELRRILESTDTPEDIKQKINETIQVII